MAKSQKTATYDDVSLVLRLYDLRREEKMREARAWFMANCQPKSTEELMKTCPPGSQENANMRMVLSYWDMVAGFITSGVLNQELFFASGRELLLTWSRMEPAIGGMRQAFKDPHVWENLETVASDYKAWMNERSPGSYDAFVAFTSIKR